jgi:hypothetical protein
LNPEIGDPTESPNEYGSAMTKEKEDWIEAPELKHLFKLKLAHA